MSKLSFGDPEPITYGLVRFMNFHQIDIKGKELFIVHLNENQEVILNDSLTLPDKAEVN